MPRRLVRYHESGQSHFLTFSCYRRKPKFADTRFYDLFPLCLEAMRLRFRMRIYGYVVMPEHVHLLVSEPEDRNLAGAMHYLKLSFSKRARSLTWGTSVSTLIVRQAQGRHWDPMNRSGRRDTMTGTCAACASSVSSCAICTAIR
jgi:REP element-mobilizing transposase RayT